MKKIYIFITTIMLCLLLCACDSHENNNSTVDIKTDNNNFLNEFDQLNKFDSQGDNAIPSETSDIYFNSENEAVGGGNPCKHDVVIGDGVEDSSYHTIPGNLISYVGSERFYDWIEEKTNSMLKANNGKYIGCQIFTIVDFVKDFNIPRDVFEAMNDNFFSDYYDYNLEVIYGDENDAEIYYSSDRTAIITEKRVIRRFKTKLHLYINDQSDIAFAEWVQKKNFGMWGFSEATQSHIKISESIYSDEFAGRYSQYSYAEFIEYFDIPRDVVEKIFKEVIDENPSFKGKLKIDALYSEIKSGSVIAYADGTPKNPNDIDRSFIDYPSN